MAQWRRRYSPHSGAFTTSFEVIRRVGCLVVSSGALGRAETAWPLLWRRRRWRVYGVRFGTLRTTRSASARARQFARVSSRECVIS